MGITKNLRETVIAQNNPYTKILEIVNDYTLFCMFFGYEVPVGATVTSPIREDNNPTVNIFPPSEPRWEGQLLYKDYSGPVMNIWRFVKEYARTKEGIILTSPTEIANFIWVKLGNGIPEIKQFSMGDIESAKERYVSTGPWTPHLLEYWEELGVTLELLNAYNVVPCYFLLNERDEIMKDFRGTQTYAYLIGDKFKIYQPNEENFKKFYNQCPKSYVQGYEQCRQETDTLLITKAMKDILVYQAHTDEWIDSIAPHGEGYIMEDNWLYWILSNYQNIVIVFDPDYAGVRGANLLRKQLRDSIYNKGNNIRVDFCSYKRIYKRGKYVAPIKDIADLRLPRGPIITKQLINHFLYDWRK